MATKDVTDQMVCMAYREAMNQRGNGVIWKEYDYPYEILARNTLQCEKVCYRAMERAHKHGLIEYGVSLRTGWLTEKGESLLNSVD